MKFNSQVKIIDIVENKEYERYFYKCLAPHPYRPYRRRREYLEWAIPRGFRKKILIFNGDVVGQIQYAPAEASGYPMKGRRVVVLNCIWVLRRAKGHNFGKTLLDAVIEREPNAIGIATIALENHYSPWFKKWQMEKLGLESLDSIKMAHRLKHKDKAFSVHLMWKPLKKDAKPPTWNKVKLLDGLTWCTAHPLYRPQTWQGPMFEAK